MTMLHTPLTHGSCLSTRPRGLGPELDSRLNTWGEESRHNRRLTPGQAKETDEPLSITSQPEECIHNVDTIPCTVYVL